MARQLVCDMCGTVISELTSPKGAFYSLTCFRKKWCDPSTDYAVRDANGYYKRCNSFDLEICSDCANKVALMTKRSVNECAYSADVEQK